MLRSFSLRCFRIARRGGQRSYVYVNVDDCWADVERDASGKLAANATSFPSGMAALGAYLHARDLRFGIYSSAGTRTCAGRAASLGHEGVDAATFASWGVDLLKYDNCASLSIPPLRRYPPMRDALAASGRPILYAMCEWNVDEPGEGGLSAWGRDVANTWRTSIDIGNFWLSVLLNLEVTEPLWEAAGPGAWNDPGEEACMRAQ
jgi:alpha-galactosidase